MILDASLSFVGVRGPKTWDTLNKTDKQQKMRVGSFVKIFGVKYTGTELCTDIKPYFAPKPARLDLY